MPRHRFNSSPAAASIALGASAAALLHAASRTAPGNPHRSLGLVLLLLQFPGEVIAHALVGGPGARMQPGEAPILVGVNALVYAFVAYGAIWSVERWRASRTPRPMPG